MNIAYCTSLVSITSHTETAANIPMLVFLLKTVKSYFCRIKYLSVGLKVFFSLHQKQTFSCYSVFTFGHNREPNILILPHSRNLCSVQLVLKLETVVPLGLEELGSGLCLSLRLSFGLIFLGMVPYFGRWSYCEVLSLQFNSHGDHMLLETYWLSD